MDQHDLLRILIKENMERQLLYEGLIFSYSPKTIISKLKKSGFKDITYNGKTININFAWALPFLFTGGVVSMVVRRRNAI